MINESYARPCKDATMAAVEALTARAEATDSDVLETLAGIASSPLARSATDTPLAPPGTTSGADPLRGW